MAWHDARLQGYCWCFKMGWELKAQHQSIKHMKTNNILLVDQSTIITHR